MADLDLDMNAPPATVLEAPQVRERTIDWGIIGGLCLGFGSLFAGMFLEGSSPLGYFILSAAVIVFGGTLGATLTSVGFPMFRRLPATFIRSVTYTSIDRVATIRTLIKFAEKARREGLLVLEDDIQSAESPFLRKGIQLVVDGTDPDLVKEILEIRVDAISQEHERDAEVWTTMGGFSPTLGIIGTVMGLVNVLGSLSDAAHLGPAIAVAFVATFYGVAFANLVYLPIGFKLRSCSNDEVASHELMLEGVLAIQSGDNPRIVEEKLIAFLSLEEKVEILAERARKDEFELAA